MKNTVMTNVISNFALMDNQHFLDWFSENREWMLEQERLALVNAANHQTQLVSIGGKPTYSDGESYCRGEFFDFSHKISDKKK